MLSFKKIYRDELLQLALILSLLRCNSDYFYGHDLIELPIAHFDFENGTSWRSLATSNALRSHYVHPKNFDAVLLNYEREMFADISALGRYNRISEETIHRPNITAYLLNVDRTSSPVNVHNQEPLGGDILLQQPAEILPELEEVDDLQLSDPLAENLAIRREGSNENVFNSGIELTQEDMDLIEILWKQDVDLGFSPDIQQHPKITTVTLSTSEGVVSPSKGCDDAIVGGSKSPDSCCSSNGCKSPKKHHENEDDEDINEKLKTLKEINGDNIKIEPGPRDTDPWAGLDYTIDTETGEYVIKGELEVLAEANGDSNCDSLDDLTLPLPEFLLDDALQLVGIDADIPQGVSKESENCDDQNPAASGSDSVSDIRDQDKLVEKVDDQPQPGSIALALLDAANTGVEPHLRVDQAVALDDDDDDLRLFDTMIQTSQFHHPHHSRAFQSRMPFVRAVSIEQHWQDLANLLSMPPGHHPSTHPSQQLQHQHAGATGSPAGDSFNHHHHQYSGNSGYHLQAPPPPPPPPMHHHHHHHHHMGMAAMGSNMVSMGGAAPYCGSAGPSGDSARNVLLHNATLNPPIGELNATGPGPAMGTYGNLGGTNLGNAVATSMNLTNSSEPMGDSGHGPHYKLEPSHDLLYYQNTTSELNQADGLLSSILNDEDLQLMDMAMNEGMYTMRLLDNANSTASSVLNPSQLSMSNGGAAAASSASSSTVSSSASAASSAAGPTTQTTRGSEMDRLDTSSDSAVSSMGSERVPSLSDGEWGDDGSDSGHTAGDHYVTDYHRKFGPYDYRYSSRQHAGGMNGAEARIPPVAQKKHQMYGKRYFQEQGNTALPAATPAAAPTPPVPIKYEYRDSCIGTTSSPYHPHHMDAGAAAKALDMKYYGHGVAAAAAQSHNHGGPANGLPLSHHHGPLGLDHVQHNHTYHLPVVSSSGAMQRPVSRDKGASAMEKAAKLKKAEEEHLTRDEKRARTLSVPISVDDIINLPMDEFNERLSKYDLSETQLSLIRDIRRRGKNKVAAQNCRKRKLDQILTLADEVKEMRDRKIRLINDHAFVTSESIRIKEKYQQLYRHVFQNLRDADGNHYSPYQYSLQTSADGSILVVPLSNTNTTNITERKEHQPPEKD